MAKAFIAIVCSLLLLQGCYTVDIIPKNTAQVNTPIRYTSWTYFWGLVEDERFRNSDKVDCKGNGLSRVTIRNNFGYTLLSFVTLGIVMPVDFECECAKDAQFTPPTE